MTPQEGEAVSQLVSIKTDDKKAFIIHSSLYVPLLLKRLSKLSRKIQAETVNRMTDLLYDNTPQKWMENEEAFEIYLRDLVFEFDSIVFAMLEFKVLFLVTDGQTLAVGQREAVHRFFDRQQSTMMPWRVILSMDRERLLKDAKLRLPLWMLIPIVRGIIRLFRKKSRSASTGRGEGTAPAPQTPVQSKAQQLQEYKEKVAKLQVKYLKSNQTTGQRLKELHETWNPLIDKTAKQNLVEDVQSLCRDTLRKMHLTTRTTPPGQERISELASRIADNSAFGRIRDRASFQNYLELYMLHVLSK